MRGFWENDDDFQYKSVLNGKETRRCRTGLKMVSRNFQSKSAENQILLSAVWGGGGGGPGPTSNFECWVQIC